MQLSKGFLEIDAPNNKLRYTLENTKLELSEVLHWSAVTRSAESAANVAVSIASLSSEFTSTDKESKNAINELREFGDTISDLFTRSLKSFISHNSEDAHKVLDKQAEYSVTLLDNWPIDLIDEPTGKILLLVRNLEKISVYARKIAEATINCEASRKSELIHDGAFH